MRSASRHISYYTSIRWDCVHFESDETVAEIRAELAGARVRVFEIDGGRIRSFADLYERVSTSMHFPFTVTNADGLNDFLRDLSYDFQHDGTLAADQPRGVVLIVANAHRLWCTAPGAAGLLIESWLFSAEFWSRVGVAFHLVFNVGHDAYGLEQGPNPPRSPPSRASP